MRFLRRALTGTFLLALTVGLLAAAGGVFWGAVQERMNREARERPARERVVAVNTVAVTAADVVPVLEAFGQVQSRRTLEIRAGAGGRIAYLSEAMEDGAEVAAGTVLARVDPTDAEAARDVARTDLAQAEADLRDAERTLALARDELTAAEEQEALRRQAIERQRSLSARGVGTAAALEDAQLAAASATQSVLTRRNAVVASEGALDQARNAVARAHIALERAERDLADTEIVAAFAGTLAEVAVTAGGLVTQNEQIARLIDPQSLEVSFQVSTAQYSRLIDARGALIQAPVRVTLDVLGLDLEARGRLTRVGATVGEGQTGRRLFAALETHAGIRPGDFVSVRVEEPVLTGVARLPATALDPAETVLALGEDSRLETVPVTLLRRQGDAVLVRAPELVGRRVVSERSPLVGPGIRVRDLTAERETGPAQAAASSAEGRIALTPERRARLIAAVEGNTRMPEDARQRVLAQLQEETVPAQTVARIESRMGG